MPEPASETIQTDRLCLVLESAEKARAMVASLPPELRSEISADWLALVENATEPCPWIHGFSVHVGRDDRDIGSVGFKGPPNDEGVVEIAYQIEGPSQNQGYATEAAHAATEYALQNDGIRAVLAHTLPKESASTRVLEKCGYDRVGEVIDPDDGRIWRWERRIP